MKTIIGRLKMGVGFVVILWVIYLGSVILGVNSGDFGIVPRNMASLPNIFTAPFFHASFAHLLANSSALIVLVPLALLIDLHLAFVAMVIVISLGGIGTWLLGSPGTTHLGASGLVFGLLGYILFSGITRRDLLSVLAAIIVFVVFGGLLFSLVIVLPGVSWSGHFFGFIGGIVAAWMLRKRTT